MAMKRLLTLARRSRSPSSSVRAADDLPLRPRPPDAMPYDRISAQVKNKVQILDPRFLKHGSSIPTLSSYSHIFPETKVTTLPNGLRVATESNLAAKTATVGVWIDSGSRYETYENYGIAHFVEHMIIKGTENMGVHLKAHTSREQTAYYANVVDKDVPSALGILADILQHSKFEEAMISHERDVILRETREWEEEVEGQTDHPAKDIFLTENMATREVIFEHLHETAFQYSPLRRSILGHELTIRTFTGDHLENYIKTHYTAHRMVIVASGAVKHEDVVSQVKSLFTKLPSNSTTSSQLVIEKPSIFTGSEVRIIDDDVPLAQFAVAFEGASWTDPDSIALIVMQAMLGSWNKSVGVGNHMGPELAQRVGINEIAESMTAFNTNYKDTGLFGVHAVAKANFLSDLAWAIMQEISKLVHYVPEYDVTRARNQLKSSLLMHVDGTSSIAEDIGRQLLTYGRRIPFAELFVRIDAVDDSTIRRVATRFIYDKDPAIVAMGPIQYLPDYNWFRRRTYSNSYY